MFDLFKTDPVVDPQLGELRRKKGMWRGSILLGAARVPLAIRGSRSAPDAEALNIARGISSSYEGWQRVIASAMFEHYIPYGEALAAEEAESPPDRLLNIRTASDVWPHTTIEFVQITPLDGKLTVEIGYRVTWDEEHTLGARFCE